MKIYTKTGDKGETGLWGGDRIGKDAVRIHAYGTVDECNAVIGVVRMHGIDKELDVMLEEVQNQLFVVGADLAAPGDAKTAIDRVGSDEVARLEKWIDNMDESLPPLKHFILPGGISSAAYLHLARTVCRRAERLTVQLSREEPSCRQAAIYLNRLADFLFTAARKANQSAKIADRPWNDPRKKKNS